jgi:hypothetical protein
VIDQDLDALERTAITVRDDPRYGTLVILPAQLLALIERVRKAEAERDEAYEDSRRSLDRVARLVKANARLQKLESALAMIAKEIPRGGWKDNPNGLVKFVCAVLAGLEEK